MSINGDSERYLEVDEVFSLLEIAREDIFVVVGCSVDLNGDSGSGAAEGFPVSFSSEAGSSESPE